MLPERVLPDGLGPVRRPRCGTDFDVLAIGRVPHLLPVRGRSRVLRACFAGPLEQGLLQLGALLLPGWQRILYWNCLVQVF